MTYYSTRPMRREKIMNCQCGEVMGEQCEWSGPVAEMVMVEWMPYQHRDSHVAARNRGTYPLNGAIRIAVERSCADRIEAEEGAEWFRRLEV